jgi:hypothetical protein
MVRGVIQECGSCFKYYTDLFHILLLYGNKFREYLILMHLSLFILIWIVNIKRG